MISGMASAGGAKCGSSATRSTVSTARFGGAGSAGGLPFPPEREFVEQPVDATTAARNATWKDFNTGTFCGSGPLTQVVSARMQSGDRPTATGARRVLSARGSARGGDARRTAPARLVGRSGFEHTAHISGLANPLGKHSFELLPTLDNVLRYV